VKASSAVVRCHGPGYSHRFHGLNEDGEAEAKTAVSIVRPVAGILGRFTDHEIWRRPNIAAILPGAFRGAGPAIGHLGTERLVTRKESMPEASSAAVGAPPPGDVRGLPPGASADHDWALCGVPRAPQQQWSVRAWQPFAQRLTMADQVQTPQEICGSKTSIYREFIFEKHVFFSVRLHRTPLGRPKASA
jgi:hypothetical protein